MSTPPSTPAGWYPDPNGAPAQRYWDGMQWTEHQAGIPTPPPPAPAPEKPKKKFTVGQVVLGVVVAIIVYLILDSLFGSDDDPSAARVEQSISATAATQDGAPTAGISDPLSRA